MLILPAIDILDGKVVRVRQGEEATAKVYSDNPLDVAMSFLEDGASMVHVVDLNAALHGDRDKNLVAIERLLSEFKDSRLGLEVAGGIRTRETADSLLAKGARRIVLSSIAYSNLDSALQILKDCGSDRIVLALDYDVQGEVRTGGWKKGRSEHVRDALSRFLTEGFTTYLLTSVLKDGMLEGPDLATLSKIKNQEYSNGKVPRLIASGGISSVKDLGDIEKLGIEEAIVGKAIYEGRIPRSIFSRFRSN